MRWVRSAADVRSAESAAIVAEQVLIQRASWAVARRAAAIAGGYGAKVLVGAGAGHNGADALWAGVHLARRGASVELRIVGDGRDEHGLAALRELASLGVRPVQGGDSDDPRAAYDVGIDGLTGLGFRPERGADVVVATVAAAMRARCGVVVAVDLPSGVAADSGAAAIWAQPADVTVTFGSLKVGLVAGRGAELAGVVEVVDIGLPDYGPSAVGVLEAADLAALLPVPGPTSTKYSRGGIGLVGGGDAYVGAAVLAGGGALRAGAGILRVHAPRETIAAVRQRWPETVGIPLDLAALADEPKVDAWVVGPGLGTDDEAAAVLDAVLARPEPVVLDADAITLIAQRRQTLVDRAAPTVLTPHTGEFGRITDLSADDVAADPLAATRSAARELGATVLLKGMRTVVCTPGGDARINPTGTPWLAAAGSGDVLAGALGAYLAAGLSALDAAACAAWMHGLAGRLAADDAPLLATDIAASWPDAVRRVRSARR